MINTRNSINRDLQCLRAFAILLVILQHATTGLLFWPSPLKSTLIAYFNGGVGVDLFLVISGFIITSGLYSKLQSVSPGQTGKRVMLHFWLKRAWRLLPSAWFWLAFPLLLVVFFNESGVWGGVRPAVEGVIAGVLNIANFRFGSCFMKYPCGPFGIYWSLSLEEQFYLVLPLLIYFLRSYFRLVITLILLAVIFVPPLWPPYYMRLDGLLLGVAIALLSPATKAMFEPVFLRHALPRIAFWVFIVLLLAVAVAGGLKVVSSPLTMFKIAALISAVMVFAASFDKDYVVRSGPIAALLVFIGDRSYTLYLAHMPAIYATRELFFQIQGQANTVPVVYYGLTFLLVLLVFTEASYRLLEIPLRNKGRRIVADMEKKAEAA